MGTHLDDSLRYVAMHRQSTSICNYSLNSSFVYVQSASELNSPQFFVNITKMH